MGACFTPGCLECSCPTPHLELSEKLWVLAPLPACSQSLCYLFTSHLPPKQSTVMFSDLLSQSLILSPLRPKLPL